MTLQLTNSQSGKKEVFKPIDADNVTMYVCGPTVYNYIHIGNGRSAVVFDLLYRTLLQLFPNITYARNFTDVDDKINAKAAAEGVEIHKITSQYIEAYNQDMSVLGNLEPTLKPKATEHINDIIVTIEKLIERHHAYESDGHVLFSVNSLESYGQLSRRNLDDMLAGARVEVADYKRHPMDFVLWKPSTQDLPGWESPWGIGRPGWHIECTAMIQKHLGSTIDIHGGGSDLMFPHHENERAQGVCCDETHQQYANYWVHNAMLDINGEKMSKSLGNFIVLRDILKEESPEVVRLSLMSAHYRSNMNWTDQLIHQSKSLLDRIYTIKREVNGIIEPVDIKSTDFFEMCLNDLNTPKAFATLHDHVNAYFKSNSESDKHDCYSHIKSICDFINIGQQTAQDWFQTGTNNEISAADIEKRIKDRADAKAAKNFDAADLIRRELADLGVQIKDTREGTQWERDR